MPVLTSPLTSAYTRLTAAFPGLAVTEPGPGEGLPQGGGWFGAASLASGGAELDAFLAWDDAQVLRDYGTRARADVVASFALHRYAWPACLLFTVPWLLEHRVPRLPVTHVAYDRMAGRMAVCPVSFACLPDDPAAALPGARVVPDEEALRTELQAAVAEHLEPLLAAFGPRMRRRGRALRATVTDEIVEGLRYIAPLLGEDSRHGQDGDNGDNGEDGEDGKDGEGSGSMERRALRELALLLPGAVRGTGPYLRASCCMFYTIRPTDTCATCPRTCGTVRNVKPITIAAA
ncbi:(2Fe-2S)-binding protein [Streptomyces sp. YIM S03343]